MESDDLFFSYCAALENRCLERLTFTEVRKGLEALSAIYVERRDRIGRGNAFDGAGKRAAFTWFYGPIHFLVARTIARNLSCDTWVIDRIVDLGCGTGAAGCGVALEINPHPSVTGIELNGWALAEARLAWQHFGLKGRGQTGRAEVLCEGSSGTLILAAYLLNELDSMARNRLWHELTKARDAGARALIIEPIAMRPLPFWSEWEQQITTLGGRADTWSISLDLPDRLQLLDKAAGLRHASVKARSLYLG